MLAYFSADNFEVELEHSIAPDLADRPLVISHGEWSRSVVRCCSADLGVLGVSAGDRVSDIQRRFPHVIVLPERQSYYEKMSLEVTTLLVSRTPAVERIGIHGWLIDLTGCDRLLRNDFSGWARQVGGILKSRFGFTATVGLASNKVTAEFACRLAKPGYALQLFPDGEEALMPRASLNLFPRLTAVQRDYLKKKRLHWVWELKELGEDRLRQWFGSRDGSQIWIMIHGHCQEPVKPYRVPRMIRKTYTFPRGTASVQDMVPAGVFLIGNLYHDVQKLGGVMRRISCQLTYSDNHLSQRDIHVAEIRREKDYAEAVTRMLENMPMRRVQVRSLSLWCPVDFEAVEQQDLFSERERIKRRELDRALTDIRDKYGFQHLHRASGVVRRRSRPGESK